MRRGVVSFRRGVLSSALAVVSVAAVFSAAAPAATPPGNFKRHVNRYWTWYAPKGWGAAYGANDIYITSPTGLLYLRYGAGGVICPATAGGFFNALRGSFRNFKGNFGLYSHPLRSASYTGVGAVTKPFGQNRAYFRQAATFKGTRRNGSQIRGEIILDIFVVDAFSGICGQRQQVRAAPSRGIGDSLRLLRIVQSVIFGPRQ